MKTKSATSLALAAAGLSLAALCLSPAARAQSIYMRDGQVVATEGLRREGGTVLARIRTREGTQGEIGYPVDSIAHIDFPEPAQLKLARDLLNAGRPDEAGRQLTPILAYYVPFHDIPGNFWLPLALLDADALGRLGQEHDLESLLSQISSFAGADPDVQREVRIMQAVAIERRGNHRQALEQLLPIVNDPAVSPVNLSEAWLAVGSAHLAQREYKEALLAFLHVPVYTPDRGSLMPAALLGSANAFVGIDDKPRAKTALEQIVRVYPSAPEAAQAKERLRQLAVAAPRPAAG